MIKDKYRSAIDSSNYEADKLYLLEMAGSNSAFFVWKKKIVFAVKTVRPTESESINTEYLGLLCNVLVNPVDENNTFGRCLCDLIVYNGAVSDDSFESFYGLCRSYAISVSDIQLKTFFLQLIELFSLPKEQSYKNLVGLIGELLLIRQFDRRFPIDVSNNWHKNAGVYAKYDFVFAGLNLEVKTSVGDENVFRIKHQQVFNSGNNYLCLIKIDEDNSGVSLNELAEQIRNDDKHSKNIEFLIKLEGEISKTYRLHRDERFSLKSLFFVSSSAIPTLTGIPSCISRIEYDYDFSGMDGITFDEFAKTLNGGDKTH